MSPETTAGQMPEAEGRAAVPDASSAALRTLAVETGGVGLDLVGRVVGRVRDRVERSVNDQPPRRDQYQPRGMVLRPALLGFAAMMAIAIGASLPSSPFKLEMPGVWFFGVPSAGGASTWGVYFVLAAVYGGLLLLMRVWWGMTRLYARRPGVPINQMMWVFALWSLPMLVIAPLFSRDVYSYAAQGEMVSHHMNPYQYGPFQLGNNSFTAPVDSLWGNAPAPYGPLFLQLDGLFARITFHNDLATIVLLRLLAFGGVLLMAACVPRLARLYHRDGAELFTLMILNPVTLLHLIGGAHNDALMLGLLLAGLVAAKEKRPIVGIVLCALATAIKAPAAIGILYVGWTWLGPQVAARDRIRPVLTAALIGAGVLEFFAFVSGLGWGWITILDTPGAVRSWTAPTTFVALVTSGVAHFFHIGVGLGGLLTLTRFIGFAAAAVAGIWLLINSDRIGTLKAVGLTLLLFVALGPVVQPWYLSWGLILLAPVALGRLRSLIIGLSMITAFIELPGGAQLVNSLIHGDPLLIVLTLLWMLVVLTVPLASWEPRDRARVPGPVPIDPAPAITAA
ncbi:MAG TPA: polyprenol phosphomannose-dependent alpha 1,6 mannosyltransferase MptB [Acidimicrobiales bacterium]|nr:polyprenol phosphomannose-dependent alpha 1,6 mannosyltransferase MptB [Acidimicrobiales bacterium]